MFKSVSLLFFAILLACASAAERPNILMIISEDNSSHWIGCYGNEMVTTPNIDALGKKGLIFDAAYSNAPVCSVARSTLITGVYATTTGTQHMRSRHKIPKRYKTYAHYLREAGYYCTNSGKTDYNFRGNDNAYWDKSSDNAHYRNRPPGQPFFAVFNLAISHESQITSSKMKDLKRFDGAGVEVLPYLPDLPEIRADMARYAKRISEMDAQVGRLIADLEKSGEAENTIVMYFSDHGGALPRGKRFLEETGVKVPLVIYIPEKFRDLSPFAAGDRISEPVSFVDIPPTLLSIVSAEIPKQMQGRPFLGKLRNDPVPNEMEFLFGGRSDEIYRMHRGLTDGQWKYIRNFSPQLPSAPVSYSQFHQLGWQAYQQAFEDGELEPKFAAFWKSPLLSEQLFDLSKDPWEMNNLAGDPAHAETLDRMRNRLKRTMAETHDTGLVPEPMFSLVSGSGGKIADAVQSESFDYAGILDLAFAASALEEANRPVFLENLKSDDPVRRYWSVVGLMNLEKEEQAVVALQGSLEDAVPTVRIAAAEALWRKGLKDEAKAQLSKEFSQKLDDWSMLALLNTLRNTGLEELVPEKLVGNGGRRAGKNDYVARLLTRLAE